MALFPVATSVLSAEGSPAAATVAGVRIKFCGLTRAADVEAACALGVDAIGFNLARGPRRIDLAHAVELARYVAPGVTVVLLVVDAPETTVLAAFDAVATALGSSARIAIQLHGNEPPAFAVALRRHCPVVKAFAGPSGLDAAHGYPADAVLIDAPAPGNDTAKGGGAGESWNYRAMVGAGLATPLILAGGLTPDNVADAVHIVRPWAVDVASGIESAPALKDPARMAAFVAAVRSVG